MGKGEDVQIFVKSHAALAGQSHGGEKEREEKVRGGVD